jgi:hypothetical protein
MTWPTETVERARELARHGLTEAKRRRKYCPRGPFTPVEVALFVALVEVERTLQTVTGEECGP